jgi:hypothetical protein
MNGPSRIVQARAFGTPGPRWDGPSARRLLPGEPVHLLADEVGMPVVPRVLLDHVDQDPGRPCSSTSVMGGERTGAAIGSSDM